MNQKEKTVRFAVNNLKLGRGEIFMQTTDRGIYPVNSRKDIEGVLSKYYDTYNGDLRKILTAYRTEHLPNEIEIAVGIHTENDIERLKRLKYLTKDVLGKYKVNYRVGITNHAIRGNTFPVMHLKGNHFEYIYNHSMLVVNTVGGDDVIGRVVRETKQSTPLQQQLNVLEGLDKMVRGKGDVTEIQIMREILTDGIDLRRNLDI